MRLGRRTCWRLLIFSSIYIVAALPPRAVAQETDKLTSSTNATQIVFSYLEKDCCSCQVEPDICGGGFYVNSVLNRIRHYSPQQNWPKDSLKVRFRIHKNGTISNLRLFKTRSQKENSVALNAVKSAVPFYRLPDGWLAKVY